MDETPGIPAQDQPVAPPVSWQPPTAPMYPPGPPFPPPPPPASRRSPAGRLGRAALVVGAAAGLAVGATALANAATSPSSPLQADTTASGSSSSSTPPGSSTSPETPGLPGGRFGPFGHKFADGPLGVGGPLLYGTFTVQGPNGYETLAERSGTVSDITNTSGNTWSLTVKSADGTSATFVVDSGTSVNGGETGISSVKQNDTVRVLALVSGGTSTAKHVTDETVLQANGNSWMPKVPEPPQSGMSSSDQTTT